MRQWAEEEDEVNLGGRMFVTMLRCIRPARRGIARGQEYTGEPLISAIHARQRSQGSAAHKGVWEIAIPGADRRDACQLRPVLADHQPSHDYFGTFLCEVAHDRCWVG